jgi:hypothetical protein
MVQAPSRILSLPAVLLAIVAATLVAAQSAERQDSAKEPLVRWAPGYGIVYVVPAQPGATPSKGPKVRTAHTPEHGTIYVIEEQPEDTRTPKQRCVDQEVAALGGSPSNLAMRTIGLKCSQR